MRKIVMAAMVAVGALALAGCEEEILVPTASVGDCIQSVDLSSAESQLSPVSCDDAHDAQVFALVNLTHSGDFDLDAIVEESNDECLARFEAFVGIDYNDSDLEIRLLHPSPLTWSVGHKETICIAVAQEMVESTFEDSEY